MGGTRQWRQNRIARGLCVDCGAVRGGDPAAPTASLCRACAGKHRAANRALRAEKRKTHGWTAGGDGTPLPYGGAAPRLHAVTCVRVRLDATTINALNEIKRRHRDARLAAGQPVLLFQLSRLVRQTIHRWANASGGYRITPGRSFCFRDVALSVQVDAGTLAIIDREARLWFAGSRAAAIRAMLVTTVNPPLRATLSRPRSPRESSAPWPDD